MISAEFLMTALIVILIPGTGVIYTLSSGLLQGSKARFFCRIRLYVRYYSLDAGLHIRPECLAA